MGHEFRFNSSRCVVPLNICASNTQVYCDMTGEKSGWTLIARFSNNDAKNWMKNSDEYWYDRTSAVGRTTDPANNTDMSDLACLLVGQRHRVQDRAQRRPEPHSTAAHNAWVSGRTDIPLQDDELRRLQRREGVGFWRVSREMWRAVWRQSTKVPRGSAVPSATGISRRGTRSASGATGRVTALWWRSAVPEGAASAHVLRMALESLQVTKRRLFTISTTSPMEETSTTMATPHGRWTCPGCPLTPSTCGWARTKTVNSTHSVL